MRRVTALLTANGLSPVLPTPMRSLCPSGATPTTAGRRHSFPRGIVQGEMPPLFVIGSDGETQIVNSRIHQNVLIVDRLFGVAELRLGSGERQQVVRILRIEPQQAEVRPAATGEAPT